MAKMLCDIAKITALLDDPTLEAAAMALFPKVYAFLVNNVGAAEDK